MDQKTKPDNTALVVIERTDVREFFVERKSVEQVLEQIRTVATGFTPDLSTKKGRDVIASQAYAVARTKTYIDGLGKELVDAEKEIPKKIDATRKIVKDYLETLKNEVRKPLDEYEAAEAQRKADLEQRLLEISAHVDFAGNPDTTAEQIQEILDGVSGIVIDDSWQEYKLQAHEIKQHVISKVTETLARRVKYEEDQAELERLRKEQEEAQRVEHERRIAENARLEVERAAMQKQFEAEQREQAAKEAQLKAEREAKEARQRLEQERVDAEERQRLAVKQAEEQERQRQINEQKRIAQEEAQRKADAEAMAANVEHQREFNREVIADIIATCPELSKQQAIKLLTGIVHNKIRHLTIIY